MIEGEKQFADHERVLHESGFKCFHVPSNQWCPSEFGTQGIGGAATVVDFVVCPIQLGCFTVFCEIIVVQGEIPLLVPVTLLEEF